MINRGTEIRLLITGHEMNVHIIADFHIAEHLLIVYTAVALIKVYIKPGVRLVECRHEGFHVSPLPACRYKTDMLVYGMLFHDTVVVVHVGSPMPYMHPLLPCLLRLQGVIIQFLGEEEHIVDTTIEQSAEPFTPLLLWCYYRLVVPDDNRLAKQS